MKISYDQINEAVLQALKEYVIEEKRKRIDELGERGQIDFDSCLTVIQEYINASKNLLGMLDSDENNQGGIDIINDIYQTLMSYRINDSEKYEYNIDEYRSLYDMARRLSQKISFSVEDANELEQELIQFKERRLRGDF